MNDLPRQAKAAVASRVDLVSVLMGNNDACSGGTEVGTFESQFKEAMTTLAQGLPEVQVKVVSIPDIYQLWDVLHTDQAAVAKWSTFHECDALLANATSTAPADQLSGSGSSITTPSSPRCAANTRTASLTEAPVSRLDPSDVSTVDYFHPSAKGQALIADVAWKALGY
ncbi:SGNH/GDSL hydrolase family protein [Amycolatopsis sp. NPDC003676]